MLSFLRKLLPLVFLAAVFILDLSAQESASSDYQYALIEALKQKNLGNISEAVKLYKLVIKEVPDCAVAHYELGTIYMMTGENDVARIHLKKAYQLDKSNKWYFLAYLSVLGVFEEYPEMVELLNERIRGEDDMIEWNYQLASVYASMGKGKKALKILGLIEEENGYSTKIVLLRASIYEGKRKYEKALYEIERALSYEPESLQLKNIAAELALKEGQETKAMAYYEDVLIYDSLNIYALTNLTEYYRKNGDTARSLDCLVKSFYSDRIDVNRKKALLSTYLSDKSMMNHYRDKVHAMLKAFRYAHPDDLPILLLATDFHISGQEYPEALDALSLYLENALGNYPMYFQAVLLANATRRNEQLLKITETALKYYPDSTDLVFFRGIGLYEAKRYEELVSLYQSVDQSACSKKDYSFQLRMLLAEGLYRLKDYSSSDSIFLLLIQEEPDNMTLKNNYSYYLAERGEYLNRARLMSKRTVEADPENYVFLDTYAWVLFRQGLLEEAEKFILLALKNGGDNDPEVNEHAGDIQRALNGKELARAYYLKAILVGGEKEMLNQKISETIGMQNVE